VEAANPPHPRPLPQQGGPGLARGGGQVRADPGQPPVGQPGPRLCPQAGDQCAAGPPGSRSATLPAAARRGPGGHRPAGSAPDQGGDRRSPGGGRGPRFGGCTPFVRPALSHLWAGPPNFGASVVYTAPIYPKIRKNHRGSITFFLQLEIQNYFFFPQRYYIGPPSFKISALCSCF
jgi:hypothetical protein